MDTGSLLRAERRRRRLSQLDLAAAAGISARHLSFIETGRSRPGRAVLAALARALGLPAATANQIMRAAGERPLYPAHGLEAPATGRLRGALERMLETHMPLPAVLTDEAWRPLRANAAAMGLFDSLAAHAGPPPPEGLMAWLFAADGLRPLVANWPAVAPVLLDRVRQEAVLHPGLDELLARLESAPGACAPPPEHDDEAVVVPLHLSLGGQELRLFSVLATFGAALDADMQRLRVEYFFPADDASERVLELITRRDPPHVEA